MPVQHAVPKKEAVVYGLGQVDDQWEIDRSEITLGSKLGAGQYGEVYEGTWTKMKQQVRAARSEDQLADLQRWP